MVRTIAIFLLVLWTGSSEAQERFAVGVVETPPFAMRTDDGAWTGMAIDIWRIIAEDLELAYEFSAVEGAMALETGEVDLVLPIYSTPDLAQRFDLSQPIYTATLGLVSRQQGHIVAVVRGLASWAFLRLVLGLSVLLLVVGAVVWLLERRRNEGQFNRRPVKGLGDGFWWAGVTLTTIGYGDKAPVTLAGRAVAMLWMLVGLAVSAALTASVVTLSGVQREVDAPEAFASQEVAAVEGDAAAVFLRREGVEPRLFTDVAAALRALDEREVEVVAAAAPALRYVVNETRGFDFIVRTTQLDPHYVAIAFPAGAAMAERVDVSLLRRLTSESGWDVIERYLPR